MTTEIDIHKAQAKILVKLLFQPQASFTQLQKGGYLTSDHFTFHLNKLLETNLIEKSDGNKYQLTPKGKEFANRFDTKIKKVERQAKIGVIVVCTRKDNNKAEYLLQQRLKQPYYGFYGFVSGKITWGETTTETAARELKEETGLSAKLTLVGIEHKIDYSKNNKLLEDKFFFIFRGENTNGTLVKKFKGGKNIWLTKNKIHSIDKIFKDVQKIISVVNQNNLTFIEKKYKEETY